jgi:hypothetical protein
MARPKGLQPQIARGQDERCFPAGQDFNFAILLLVLRHHIAAGGGDPSDQLIVTIIKLV